MIWIKPKTVVLDCFTWREEVYENTPIQPLRNAIPQWWKDLPNYNSKTFTDFLNMKGCPGFIDNFKNGFYSPFWCDASIEAKNNELLFNTSDNTTRFEAHTCNQWGNDFVDNTKYKQIKIISPWYFKTNKYIKFALMPAFWNQVGINNLSGLHIVPGIVNFHYQHAHNINMFFEKNKKYNISIHQPLSYYIPLTENKIKIKNHCVSFGEYQKVFNSWYQFFFAKKYLNFKKIIK